MTKARNPKWMKACIKESQNRRPLGDHELFVEGALWLSEYLARKRGLVGGKARAAALSKKRRQEIARNAALARYTKRSA